MSDVKAERATVTCVRCGREEPIIVGPLTFVGDLGEQIRAEVCRACWQEWLGMQLMVINEYRLHMGEASHREALEHFAARFFKIDGGDGSLGPGPQGGLE